MNNKQVDTVKVRAVLLEAEMLPQGSPDITYLENKKVLPARHHYYSVKVHLDNCNTDQWLTCGDNSKTAKSITASKPPAKVELTCIIFKDNKMPISKDKPFVVVSELRISDQ